MTSPRRAPQALLYPKGSAVRAAERSCCVVLRKSACKAHLRPFPRAKPQFPSPATRHHELRQSSVTVFRPCGRHSGAPGSLPFKSPLESSRSVTPQPRSVHRASTSPPGRCARAPGGTDERAMRELGGPQTRPLTRTFARPQSARCGHRLAAPHTAAARSREDGLAPHPQGALCLRAWCCEPRAPRTPLTDLAPLQELKDLQNDPPTQCSAGAFSLLAAVPCGAARRGTPARRGARQRCPRGAVQARGTRLQHAECLQDPSRRTTSFTGRRRSWGAAALPRARLRHSCMFGARALRSQPARSRSRAALLLVCAGGLCARRGRRSMVMHTGDLDSTS